jgi:hypothetical protein
MTDHIAGNPASFPASVALWEDSDPPDAAHFNLGPEDLADRTSNLDARVTAEVADRTAAIAAAIHLLTQIIDVQSAAVTATYDTAFIAGTATTLTLVTGVTVTFTSKCNPGDILVFGVSTRCDADGSSVGAFQMRVVDGATNVDLDSTLRKTPSDGSMIFYDINASYVLSHVTTGGTVTLKMMFKRDSGSGQVYVHSPATLWAQLIRPGS